MCRTVGRDLKQLPLDCAQTGLDPRIPDASLVSCLLIVPAFQQPEKSVFIKNQ